MEVLVIVFDIFLLMLFIYAWTLFPYMRGIDSGEWIAHDGDKEISFRIVHRGIGKYLEWEK